MKISDHIDTERLILRHWNIETDIDAFHRLNNDPDVMAFFPGRRTLDESISLLKLIGELIEKDGYGWSAIVLKSTDEVIGFGGLAAIPSDFPNGPNTEIGWRFLPEVWGYGYATEAANACLAYGFRTLNLNKILSFAVTANTKSFAVMDRIGMIRKFALDFDHPHVTQDYPHLVRHGVCQLTREQWLERIAAE